MARRRDDLTRYLGSTWPSMARHGSDGGHTVRGPFIRSEKSLDLNLDVHISMCVCLCVCVWARSCYLVEQHINSAGLLKQFYHDSKDRFLCYLSGQMQRLEKFFLFLVLISFNLMLAILSYVCYKQKQNKRLWHNIIFQAFDNY